MTTPAAVELTKGTLFSASGSGVLSIQADTLTGALCVVDSSGNISYLGAPAVGSYRLERVLLLTGSGTYTPTAGSRAVFIEGVGGGGGGGGVATAAVNSGAAGGGGAYSASWITTLAASYAYVCGVGGPGGTAGANPGTVGGDSTIATTTIVAKGGSGGIADTIAAIHSTLGGAGGLSSGGTGDMKTDGAGGGYGLALAAAQAVSGFGGTSYFGGGIEGRNTQGAGAAAANYGAGGAGGCAVSGGASVAGGAGGNGCWRVWECS